MEKEIWKDIEGYEGIYQVSNLGRIKSLEREEITNGAVKRRIRKEKILCPHPNGEGYPSVVLSKNGRMKTFKVHRLVAEAFIPNPENKPFIDHINRNKTNNTINNLRWCTGKENMSNPLTKEHLSKTFKELGFKRSKKVLQLDKNGKVFRLWNNARAASEDLKIDSKSIYYCCLKKPKYKTAGGYKWLFLYDYLADWLEAFQDECMEKEKVA